MDAYVVDIILRAREMNSGAFGAVAAQMAALQAQADALNDSIRKLADSNAAAAISAAALQRAMGGDGNGASGVPLPVGGGSGDGGGPTPVAAGGASWWSLALAGLMGRGAGGQSPLMRLLWGGGGMFGIGAGLGSLGAFAGFGPEHLLFTGLGLSGSAVGAGLGGGLLGLGALGTMAVGGGSDMAVMKSTIADTKSLYSGYNALNQAILVYGKNSTQAQTATAQLNALMVTLGNTAGVRAEAGLARATVALNMFWDKATSAARVQAVHILTQVETLARDYIPRVAAAATRNLSIINQGLKPLFSWLEGPAGTSIFDHLENIFAKDLPTAIHAFDQGLELLLRTINLTAGAGGHLLTWLNNLLTYFNGAGWDKWAAGVDKLVNLFYVWAKFVEVLGRDIIDMFTQTAGLGQSIIVTLTGMLEKLGEWERSVSGRDAMHNLFEVHKQEVLDLLQLLPPLLSALGNLYLTVAPPLTKVAILLIEITTAAVNFLTTLGGGVGWLASWAIGLELINLRTGFLTTALNVLIGSGLARFIPLIGEFITQMYIAATATGAETGAMAALSLAMDANPIGLVALGVAALGVGLVLLIHHLTDSGNAARQASTSYHNAYNSLQQMGTSVDATGHKLMVLKGQFQQTSASGQASMKALQAVSQNATDGIGNHIITAQNHARSFANTLANQVVASARSMQSQGGSAVNAFVNNLIAQMDRAAGIVTQDASQMSAQIDNLWALATGVGGTGAIGAANARYNAQQAAAAHRAATSGTGGPSDSQLLKLLMGKAGGGPVKALTPYVVGERGPELFIPSGSGTIVPNNRLRAGFAGPQQVTIQVFEANNAHATAALIRRELAQIYTNR